MDLANTKTKNNAPLFSIYLINPTVLNAINYLRGVMASSWCAKDGATTFMDIIDNLGCQSNGIARIETSVSSLQTLQQVSDQLMQLDNFVQNSHAETTPLAANYMNIDNM